MREPDLTAECEFRSLRQLPLVHCFRDAEQCPDDVHGAIALVRQRLDCDVRVVNRAASAQRQRGGGGERVRLVTDFEHVLLIHQAEAAERRLQVVERLAHVAVRCEDDGLQTARHRRHALRGRHGEQARQDVGVGEAREADDGAARLQRLDYFFARVARERKPRGVAEHLHRAPQRLLRRARHRVRLVEEDDLVAARRQRDVQQVIS